MLFHVIWVGILGFIISLGVINLILKRASGFGLAQLPRELHHTHRTATPRVGGLGFAAAFLVVEAALQLVPMKTADCMSLPPAALIASVAMFGLGFWDDLQPLHAWQKLVGQILISFLLCFCGLGIQRLKLPFSDHVFVLAGWGVPLTVVWLVGMTNLINFIDGIDGLAAGISLILMILLGYVGHQTGSFELEAAGMAGALLAFLYYNLPPARIYMGDGGAYFLGFEIGLLALLNSHKGELCATLAAPVFVLAVPIVDALLAILRRGLRGLPVFRPDRRHLHHHLLRSGLSRGRAILVLYTLTLIFLMLGVGVYHSHGRWAPVLFGFLVLSLLLCAGGFQFSRRWFDVPRMVAHSLHMRNHIRYARCLCRSLSHQRSSVNTLWSELISAADRLGFVSLRIKFYSSSRFWERPGFQGAAWTFRYEFEDGYSGSLEFGAPTGQAADVVRPPDRAEDPANTPKDSQAASLGRFEIVSELLAEAWVQAMRASAKGKHEGSEFCSENCERTIRLKLPVQKPCLAPAGLGTDCFSPGNKASEQIAGSSRP